MDNNFFIGNRQRLISVLPTGSTVVLAAFDQVQRNVDSSQPFEQEANFWYLTGINAPGWRLVVISDCTATLIAPFIGKVKRIFDGGLSFEQASQISGIKHIVDSREGAAMIKKLSVQSNVYSILPKSAKYLGMQPNSAQARLVRSLGGGKKVNDVRSIIAGMRAVKQPAEIQALQKAVDTTIAGITEAIGQIKDARHEYQIEAALSYGYRSRGAQGHAFDPIVASGGNACTLHYIDNNNMIAPNDWVVIDTGAKVGGYNADITRTVPKGDVTDRQKAIYNSVLRVHDTAVAMCKVGQDAQKYFQQVDQLMAEELVTLGLIKNIKDHKGLRKYFPHSVSHSLGIDTHDPTGGIKKFMSGMVLTVEPGIYVPEENFGVRIEDDVLITDDGSVVLSAALPTKLEDLQRML